MWKAPQASFAAFGREKGKGEGEGEGTDDEGCCGRGGGDGDGVAPAPAPNPEEEESNGGSGTCLGALLTTTEKSPHGSPHVHTSPSSVRNAEFIPPAATCFSLRCGTQRTGVRTSRPVREGSEPH